MKCHASVNPPNSPNSEPWPNLLMAASGKAKKKLVKNMVDSLWRKRLKGHTINLIPLHRPRTITRNCRRNNSLRTNLARPLTTRGSYTEPRILMESIRSPGKLLELDQESTWSPSGVHQESPWSPSASSHCALPKNPAGLQVYSCWTPDGVHQDGDFSRTPDPIP